MMASLATTRGLKRIDLRQLAGNQRSPRAGAVDIEQLALVHQLGSLSGVAAWAALGRWPHG